MKVRLANHRPLRAELGVVCRACLRGELPWQDGRAAMARMMTLPRRGRAGQAGAAAGDEPPAAAFAGQWTVSGGSFAPVMNATASDMV
jgi:hypothetical protein